MGVEFCLFAWTVDLFVRLLVPGMGGEGMGGDGEGERKERGFLN